MVDLGPIGEMSVRATGYPAQPAVHRLERAGSAEVIEPAGGEPQVQMLDLLDAGELPTQMRNGRLLWGDRHNVVDGERLLRQRGAGAEGDQNADPQAEWRAAGTPRAAPDAAVSPNP